MSKNLRAKLDATLESGVLLQYVDDSLAARQVLDKLGFAGKGQYAQIVREYLIDNDIDISHFTPNGRPYANRITKVCPCCNKPFTVVSRKEKEQVVCSRACSNTYFRSGKDNPNWVDGASSYREKTLALQDNKCNRCGYHENKAALVVHHKDHNRANNSIDNLEILCANCHAIHHWG